MYKVTLHDGPNDKEGLIIHSPYPDTVKTGEGKVKLGINAIDSFSFTIYPNNPGYAKIKPLITLIKIYDTKQKHYIFEGRVLIPSSDFSAEGVNKSFVCESELGYLHDSIQSFKKIQSTSPKELLQIIIDNHNSQVESYKQFKVGIVEVTNSTDNVYRYIDDTADTYDTMMDKLVNRDALGGELRVRKVNGQLYIDWLKQIGTQSEVDIRLAKNLIEMTSSLDPSSIITRLFPRGERVSTDDNQNDASQPRLTIASVNNGVEYLDAPKEMIHMFGIQGGVVTFDDVTKADILKKKGNDWLSNQLIATGNYQIKAVDLGLIKLDTDTYQAGNIHHVYNPLTSTDLDLRIMSITIPINDPASTELAFGDRQVTMSQYQTESKNTAQQVKSIYEEVKSQTKSLMDTQQKVSDTQEKIDKLKQNVSSNNEQVQRQITSMIDNLGQIASSVPTEETMSTLTEFTLQQERTNKLLEERLKLLEEKR